MRRQERPKIEVKNGTSNGPGAGGDSSSNNIAIENVESDIDELSDQMNEMTRRMLRIEEKRQVSVGEIQWFAISWAADPCRSVTMRFQ